MSNKVIIVQSFGMKYGMPTIGDYILDVRFLPNPFYVPELKELTGNDKVVQDYITAQPQTARFLKCLEEMLDCVVAEFVKKDKPQLVISVGCTGGRHRSVYVAIMLVKHLLAMGYNAQASHRDIDR